jgi:hypothetical protein
MTGDIAVSEHASNDTPRTSVFDDLEAIRLVDDGVALVERVTTIPVRKPAKTWFIRTRTEAEFSFLATIFEDRDDARGDVYFVLPAARHLLEGLTKTVQLTLAANVQGIAFLWPVAVEDGAGRSWNSSARAALDLSRTTWVRVQPDMTLAAYRLFTAKCQIDEPRWPDLSMQEILKISFGDRIIADA